MPVVPRNNLPPESQPWARDRDAAIEQLQFDAAKNAEDNKNAFIAVNNSLTAISGQLADIATVQAEQAIQQAALASQQATLLAQQTQINATIASLLNTGSVGNSASGFNHNSTGFYAGANITVPAGYTKATVLCIVDTSGGLSSGTGYFQIGANIGGVTGGSVAQAGSVTEGVFSCTGSAIRTLTGLTGGSLISVALHVMSASGSWNTGTAIANCNAIALFTK